MYATLFAVIFTAAGLSQALTSLDNALVPRTSPNNCPQLKNPPPGNHCGQTGKLTAPSLSGYGTGQAYFVPSQYEACLTLGECTDKCKDVGFDNCKSFSFEKATNECIFYNETISKQGFKPDASTHTEYYDAACFKCTSCEPNLYNGGWESGTAHPWIVEYSSLTKFVKGYKSKYAIAFTSFINENAYHGVNQWIHQCPNTTYNLDFEYKYISSGNGSIGMSATYFDNTREVGGDTIFGTSSGAAPAGVWYHASGSFVSGPSTGGNIDIFIGGVDSKPVTYYIDNIVISPAS